LPVWAAGLAGAVALALGLLNWGFTVDDALITTRITWPLDAAT
jgi:hypothetical protein